MARLSAAAEAQADSLTGTHSPAWKRACAGRREAGEL